MDYIPMEFERAAVKAAMQAWIDCAESRDNSKVAQAAVQDSTSVWIGPMENQWMVGFASLQKAMEEQNAGLQSLYISVSDEIIHVQPEAHTAWATNRWIFRGTAGGQEMSMALRCTWVMEKRAGQWVVVHFHKSAGLPT